MDDGVHDNAGGEAIDPRLQAELDEFERDNPQLTAELEHLFRDAADSITRTYGPDADNVPEFHLRGIVTSIDRLRRFYTLKAPSVILIDEMNRIAERLMKTALLIKADAAYCPDPKWNWIFTPPPREVCPADSEKG